MIAPWWSWALTATGAAALWLAGSGRRSGWALGVGAQLLWVAYALATRQYGFLASAAVYGWVYLRNWHRHPYRAAGRNAGSPDAERGRR